jgi:hypothetical protein
LTVQAGDAIDTDDGQVSLWWNIWSEDPVLIDGQTTDSTQPVSAGGHPMPEPKYEINTIDPRPMCDTPHPVVELTYECYHDETYQEGDFCATDRVIENVLVTASCVYHPDRAGPPQCEVDELTDGSQELIQYVYVTPCPAQILTYFVARILYSGCGFRCSPTIYQDACPTTPVDPALKPIATVYGELPRKVIGCE